MGARTSTMSCYIRLFGPTYYTHSASPVVSAGRTMHSN